MKRITIPVDGNIDNIRDQLNRELGIYMSYHQVVDYLINYYRKHNRKHNLQPTTAWAIPPKHIEEYQNEIR